MNVVRIMGGLGNQMFQYAFGKAVNARYDLSWFKSYTNHAHPRPYRLDKFNTKVVENAFLPQVTVEERKVGFDIRLLQKTNTNFYGYWQWLAYYRPLLSDLRDDFQLKKECYTNDYLRIRQAITERNSVSVHVRRGDYLIQKGFHELPFRYYIEALECVDGDLFIFSDDIKWCKDKFKQNYFNRQIFFVDLEDYLSFDLMKNCTHNIMANSTFSWWASFLNNHENKIVVTPREWLCNNIQEVDNNEVYFPKEWIKINGNAFQNV